LNEIAQQSGVGIRLSEDQLPFHPSVSAACEILGLDPLYVANEGKCLVIVSRAQSEELLRGMRQHACGKESKIIGEVMEENPGRVLLRTKIGGTRILSMLTGEQLPRIC
jgi:hydrogenase expression/formation protein HypE